LILCSHVGRSLGTISLRSASLGTKCSVTRPSMPVLDDMGTIASATRKTMCCSYSE
jgi:hypothetical protein